jgi:peptide chain release factor subunit 1
MKLHDRTQVEKLARFHSHHLPTTSFFFDTDKSRQTKKELGLVLKNMITASRDRLAAMDLDKDKKDSLAQDLDKIQTFADEQILASRHPGLAIFSCSGENFWQEFSLADAPRNRLLFDQNPYVRPLTDILDSHPRVCLLLLDRKEAQWYEVVMDEGRRVDSLRSDVPTKIQPPGGSDRKNTKTLERRISAHIHDHFKKAAQITLDILKKAPFDWLFVGTIEAHRSGLEDILHPYLKSRLTAWLKAKPSTPPDEILKEAVELEHSLKKKEEESIVAKLITELEKGGLAVSGIKATLESLNQYQVQTLVVTRNDSVPGFICRSCAKLYLAAAPCPTCGKELEPLADVVDEAIEAAYRKNCPVRHITSPSKLDRFGKIGAFLKYKNHGL